MAYTEKQLVAALRRLEKNWPDGYSLFSWSGTLHLMRDDKLPTHEEHTTHPNGHSGYTRSYRDGIVKTFGRIPSDGGDPD